MAGLFPVVAFFQRTLGVDQHIGDVLDVADLPLASANLEQRIVGTALDVGRVEEDHTAEMRAPAGGEHPVLALDVMHDRRARPRQQGRNDETHALAAPGRGEAQHMLGPMMAQIGGMPSTQQHAIGVKEPGFADLPFVCPAGGAVGRGSLHLSRPPHGHGDGDNECGDSTGAGDEPAGHKNLVRVGVEREPPPKEGWREVDRPSEEREPGAAKLRLEGELPGCPFGRRPDEAEHGRADHEDLEPENLGRVHGDATPARRRVFEASMNCAGSNGRTRWARNRMNRAHAFTGPAPVSGSGPNRLVRQAP